jgi:putative Mg2+ transporter-C (MgtC) family protein
VESLLAPFFQTEIGFLAVVERLVVAAVLGGILGFDREILARPAGIRTHMLVCLAAATFTVLTFELVERAKAEGISNVDPIRIIEAVTAGAGFLAAGIIFQSGSQVHGLTTGAGVWTAAAIGVACGTGAYAIAAITTVIVLFVLFGLQLLKERLGWDQTGPPADRLDNPALGEGRQESQPQQDRPPVNEPKT